MESIISQEDLQFYQENGYLHIKQFADKTELTHLKQRARYLIENLSEEQRANYTSSRAQQENQHFLNSANGIFGFYECLKQDDIEVGWFINKIGHAIHDQDEAFRAFSYSSKVRNVVHQLPLVQPGIIQSQYILKLPLIGAEVKWHRDSTFLYTEPLSCTALWLAVDDATEENGCLVVFPKSHQKPLKKRFIQENNRLKFVNLHENEEEKEVNPIALPAQKGDLIILHGSLLHYSNQNKTTFPRNAYVMHLIDQQARYDAQNWLQRSIPLNDL